MTEIEFFFDPSCPFCWITSRWLLEVQGERDIDITWRQFSLAIKNKELANDGSDESPHGEVHRAAHNVNRVILAAVEQGASAIDLYTAFGTRNHIDGRKYDDAMITEVLAEQGLSADLAKAAQDTSYDAKLEKELQSALDAAGGEVGVPTIVFTGKDGKRLGYFGPVLNEMPEREEGLAIWDGLEKLATVTSFYELKRTRPKGGPDTASTAGRS